MQRIPRSQSTFGPRGIVDSGDCLDFEQTDGSVSKRLVMACGSMPDWKTDFKLDLESCVSRVEVWVSTWCTIGRAAVSHDDC